MNIKPVLIIMAAGLGSRYGGLKQIAPVDEYGHILMDYAIYDAERAGFETVICILSADMVDDFYSIIGNRISSKIDLQIAIQSLDDIPHGFVVPEGRVKPWGTSQAVLSAKNLVNGPMTVINADDFYGADAYSTIYNFLVNKSNPKHHALVGYKLENTLTEYGHVARGVCEVSNDKLTSITEHMQIEKRDGGARSFYEDGSCVFLPEGTVVSMNFWGYGIGMMDELDDRFSRFLKDDVPGNPLKAEYLLPRTSNDILKEGIAEFSVLHTNEKWCGVTYAQDMSMVQKTLLDLRKSGKYPMNISKGT